LTENMTANMTGNWSANMTVNTTVNTTVTTPAIEDSIKDFPMDDFVGALPNVTANLTENMTANMTGNWSANMTVNTTVNTTVTTPAIEDIIKDFPMDDFVGALPVSLSNETTANSSSFDELTSEATKQAVGSGDCSDVHGKYANAEGQEVSIYQDGCALNVTTFSEESNSHVSKPGKVVGEIMKVEDFEHAGMVTSLGDIFFADGQQWAKANSTSNATAVANYSTDMLSTEDVSAIRQDFTPSSTSKCTDVHGKYTSMVGQEVEVYQVGCFLKVKMPSNDGEKASLKSGRIVGEDLRVEGLHTSGRVTADGDIFFADDNQWMRGSKAVTLSSDVATDSSADSALPNSAIVNTALANSTGNVSDTAMSVEATFSNESNTTFANASAANTTSANITFANASANITDAQSELNVTSLNVSLNYTLPTSSVVQAADANDDEDFLVDQDCPDVSGTYETTQGAELQEVTVYQIGCYLKVKMPSQEELSLKSGKIQGNFLYIKDVQQPGIMTLSGDVLFGNGGDWKKKHSGNSPANQSSSWNETANGSANASINGSANESVDSRIGDPSAGPYINESINASVNANQVTTQRCIGELCFNASDVSTDAFDEDTLNPLLESSNDTVQALTALGSNGTLLDFAAAATTISMDAGSLMDTVRGAQDQCLDFSGHYVTSVGKLITMAQSACNLDVQLWWDSEHGEVLTKGTIVDNEVQIDGFLEKGHRTDESITFPAGAHWRKLSATDVATVKKDGCADVSGTYGDQSGSIVTVMQTGCHAAVKVPLGAVKTRPKLGHIVGDELQLFDQSTPGRRMQDGSLDFGASAYWGKLTDEQAIRATQDDCASTDGHYRDSKGDIATITQEQCHVSVQMKWDGQTGNVTLGGHIFGDSFHIKEFHSSGLIAKSGQSLMASSIDFSGALWHKMSNEEAIALGIPEAGCDNFEGSYVDTNGKKAVVTQTGCKIAADMWWNDVLGNIAVEGHVSRGTLHIRGLDDAEKSEFGIRFGEDKHWTKMDSLPAADASVTATAVHPVDEMTSVSDPLVQSDQPQMTGDTEDEMMDIQPM